MVSASSLDGYGNNLVNAIVLKNNVEVNSGFTAGSKLVYCENKSKSSAAKGAEVCALGSSPCSLIVALKVYDCFHDAVCVFIP